MAVKPITIHSPCFTTPDQHVKVRVGDRVRWHAERSEIYLLKLKGGFFEGRPDDFDYLVFGQIWTEDLVVNGPLNASITNYIRSLSGGCLLRLTDGPPDIIIESGKPSKKRAGKK